MIALHPHDTVERGMSINLACGSSSRGTTRRCRPAKRKRLLRPAGGGRSELCRSYVFDLLYGPRRVALARKLHTRVDRIAKCAARKHTAKHGPSRVQEVVRDVLVQYDHLRLPVEKGDASRTAKIVAEVMAVWKSLVDSPYYRSSVPTGRKHIRFGDVVLGILYIMRGGGLCDFVPGNLYLSHMLPDIAHVGEIGFRVKRVTVGKNHVLSAFRSLPRTETRGPEPHSPHLA